MDDGVRRYSPDRTIWISPAEEPLASFFHAGLLRERGDPGARRTFRGAGRPSSRGAGSGLFHQVPALDVPIFLIQGRHDKVAPGFLTRRYFDRLDAPKGKKLVWFESSAHMPHYEESERFAAFLKETGPGGNGQKRQKNF